MIGKGTSLWFAACLLVAWNGYGQCSVTCSATVPLTGSAGSPVQFESTAAPCNCSGSPSFAWTFGDSESSTDQNPSHTYASDGTYNWQLTVTSESATCNRSGTITIGNAINPVAGTYSGTNSLGQPFSITVNGSSQVTGWSYSYNCGFGSGSGSASTTCPIVGGSFSCGGSPGCTPFALLTSVEGTFTSSTSISGTFHLRWMPGISGCCTQDPTYTVSNAPDPLVAAASGDTPSGFAPLMVNFTGSASGGTPPYTYSWNFGDCSATSSDQNPSHSYAAGNWNAVLTVTDSALATDDAVVPVDAVPLPATSLELTAPASAAVGAPITVTVVARDANLDPASGYTGQVTFSSSDGSATLPSNYTFTGGDSGTHEFTNAVTMQTPGTRTLTVTDTADGGLTDTVNITVGHATSTSVTSSPNPTAQGAMAALTATVTSSQGTPAGNVTFKDGATSLGTVALAAGAATLNTSALGGGPHSITAEYAGSATHLASTSPEHIHYVLLSAPTGLSATATTATKVVVTWSALAGAATYDVLRSTDNSSFSLLTNTAATTIENTPVSAGTAYFYRVRGRDGGNNAGATSATDPAVTVIFTDDPVTTATTVKTVHISQLRTAVNAMRAAAGQGAASFTDPTLTPESTVIRVPHVQELRNALAGARSALLLPALTFTDPTLTAQSTEVKAIHVTEVRNGVK